MSAALDLPDLHTRQMNTLRRLRAAYDLNMLALRAAAPADREPRKELEQHLADTINLMQGCVYTVNHALSNAEAHERNAGVALGAPGAWNSCSHVPGASCADEAECSGDGGCVRLWPRDAQPKGPIPFPRDKPGMYPAPGVLGTEQIHPFWCHEQSHDRPRCITQCSECADDGAGVALPRADQQENTP